MANSNYRAWMEQVNAAARRRGFLCCRNRWTWAAYRAGMTPAAYVESIETRRRER